MKKRQEEEKKRGRQEKSFKKTKMELKETPAVEDQSLLTSQPTVHIIKSTSKDGRQGKEGNREEKQDIFCLNLK